MREPLAPADLLALLARTVRSEKGLPGDDRLPAGVVEAFQSRRAVAGQLLELLADLQGAARRVVALATEGLGRVDPRAEPPQAVSLAWMAHGERVAFVMRRVLELLDEAWLDPLGVDATLGPSWDLSSCTVSRTLASVPGVVGTTAAYVDPTVLQYLSIQARVVAELTRASLHEILATQTRLAGGPVPVDGTTPAERVRRLRVKRPLGEPVGPAHLGPLAEAWLAAVAADVRRRPESPRAAHKRERWLADDGRRLREHLVARQRAHLRRLKVELRRLQARAARASRQFAALDARVRALIYCTPPANPG